MSTPFIGQICIFPFSWTPYGFLSCDGSLCAIQNFPALYSLIGAVYGGDAKTTFAVPNLGGLAIVGLGQAQGGSVIWNLGASHGAEGVALPAQSYLPVHNHQLQLANNFANTGTATANAMLGGLTPNQYWAAPAEQENTQFPQSILGPSSNSGTGAPHENRQPYMVFNTCIAWDGEYPDLSS